VLDLQGVNLVLCDVEQSIPEGRDPFLIGSVSGLMPVPIRDGIQGVAHDGSGRDLVDLCYVPLAAGDLAIPTGPAECVPDAGGPAPTCRSITAATHWSPGASIRTFKVVIDAPADIDPFRIGTYDRTPIRIRADFSSPVASAASLS
jgi:hypothetical protein